MPDRLSPPVQRFSQNITASPGMDFDPNDYDAAKSYLGYVAQSAAAGQQPMGPTTMIGVDRPGALAAMAFQIGVLNQSNPEMREVYSGLLQDPGLGKVLPQEVLASAYDTGATTALKDVLAGGTAQANQMAAAQPSPTPRPDELLTDIMQQFGHGGQNPGQ